MVPSWLKQTYYALFSPVMRANAFRYRIWPTSCRRAHLGPGQSSYISGWVNVDANLVTSTPDVWADLRYKLPFPDNHLECVYSHHVVEHLPDLDYHFSEMFRCLKPGGLLRIGGPHGDNAIRALVENRSDWFNDWPVKRSSIGGRFENFIFCMGEHTTILTESFLQELAQDAGFEQFSVSRPGETSYPEIITADVTSLESDDYPMLPKTLMIEVKKPGL